MKNSKSIVKILIVAMTFCHASCHNDQQPPKDQDVRLAPGEYIADEPKEIMAYFRALCRESHAMVAVHGEPNDTVKVWQAVRYLDDYAAGRRDYYPAEDVRQALSLMVCELGYGFSHWLYLAEPGDEIDSNFAEIFFFRFLEQAVRLSPEVDYVTDFHCDDGTAGILNYHEWSPNPLYSFLVYPTEKGLRVTMVGGVGNTRIEKLFHLTDDEGREYYLCSNNGGCDNGRDFNPSDFCQYLFLLDDGKIKQVASTKGLDFYPGDFEGKMIFNPRLLRWDYCTQNGDIYTRIDGSQSLVLHLDGDKSSFKVE